jgi:hypothetical protein
MWKSGRLALSDSGKDPGLGFVPVFLSSRFKPISYARPAGRPALQNQSPYRFPRITRMDADSIPNP